VTTELREVPVEDLSNFMDEFNHLIFDMISSHDMNERKGAIMAIGIYLASVANFFTFHEVFNS